MTYPTLEHEAVKLSLDWAAPSRVWSPLTQPLRQEERLPWSLSCLISQGTSMQLLLKTASEV